MWIITKDGFVSLVAHQDAPDIIRARARRLEHLADTFDLADADIIDLGPAAPDYRWHANIPRVRVAQKLYDAVMDDLDYSSHVKEEVAGTDNVMYRAMLSCWTALHQLQKPPRPEHDWWSDYDEWEARNRAYLDERGEPVANADWRPSYTVDGGGTFRENRAEMGAERLGSDVTTRKVKRLAPDFVWCDHHCEIHTRRDDTYDEGTPECNPVNWRRVFVETDDPDETF